VSIYVFYSPMFVRAVDDLDSGSPLRHIHSFTLLIQSIKSTELHKREHVHKNAYASTK